MAMMMAIVRIVMLAIVMMTESVRISIRAVLMYMVIVMMLAFIKMMTIVMMTIKMSMAIVMIYINNIIYH